MALAPGARLGPYEVVSPLGAGGMGEVYRARDTRLGRDVAIKVLPAGMSSDPERLQRFEQEARAAAALNHPNILAVFDIGEYQSSPYIVSEVLDGQTLRERLASGPLPVRKAIEYAIQVAKGLAAAHEKGIVHRDLKPDNVFVTADGRVKILDFGLAKLTEREPAAMSVSALPTTPPLTMAGMVLGTIGYMAPEQVRGMAADPRTDIFAFGALLYEMLSGRRAFPGDTTIDVMTAILKEDPPDLSAADRPMPPALQRIVDRCLEKNPASRFQTAADLAFALESLSVQSGTAHAGAATDAPTSAPALWGRRAAMLWAAVAIVLLVATVMLAIGYVSRAPAAPSIVRFEVHAPAGTAFDGGVAFAPAAAISPDGRHMVFMTTRTGAATNQLWLRSFDAPDARPLAGTEQATFPFWSPDSRSIAFFAQGKLKRIDMSGGPVQTVCDAAAGEGGTWNRDGVIVFAPDGAAGLVRVSATGGQPTPVTTLRQEANETSHRWPDFLPDGRHFLFLSRPDNVIRIGSLDSRDVTRIVNAGSRAEYAGGYLLFVRETTLVAQPFDAAGLRTTGDAIPVAEGISANPDNGRAAFAGSDSGLLAYRSGGAGSPVQLTWFDRAGKEIGKVGPVKDYRGIDLSPDGGRIVVHLHDLASGGGGLWMVDSARGSESRFTFNGAHAASPHWSPDGSRIVFSSLLPGKSQNLYVKPAGGAAPEELVLESNEATSPRSWSADGRFIVYEVNNGKTASSDVWVMPMTGDRKPIPFLTTPAGEAQGELSPDGRWMTYVSNESGGNDVYVQPFPATGGKWLISTGGGLEPHWRRDGKELYYVSGMPRKLMAVDVKADRATFDAGVPRALFDVLAMSIQGGMPGPGNATGAYIPSADGQKFLATIRPNAQVSIPVIVTLNWTAGLKK